ncbi:DegT/DnrJ/EryC1/StrS family aminotransferase [Candidatus Latescibacterota bacterium]
MGIEMIDREREVPFFNYAHVFTQHEGEVLRAIGDVGRRGAFILQRDLVEFEERLAEYVGAGHCIGVANGTDALIISLRTSGIGSGDEVIFCAHTYVATAAAIHFVGATPVPVECRADHLIDPSAVRLAVTDRTRAIMPTQVNGRTCEMDALQQIGEDHNLILIEDAAQALGSQYRGQSAGTFGLAGTFSFYPAKNLGSLGDGGAIVTDDDQTAAKCRLLRDHGRDGSGEVVCWGLNSRLDNLQAAVLDCKLRKYDREIARRREIASLYERQLAGVGEVKLPPGPESDRSHFDVYQNYEIEAERRDALKAYLRQEGVGTVVQWGGKPVHLLRGLGFDAQLPFTERMFEHCLLLPLHTALSDEDVSYVASKVKSFYAESPG